MATKRFCDCCGREVGFRQFTEFSIKKHIDQIGVKEIFGGFVDSAGNPVSDASVSYDLCNACYNSVAMAAMEIFKDHMHENH